MKVQATTGAPEIDRLAGGIIPGDNIVWEVDSGVPVGRCVERMLPECLRNVRRWMMQIGAMCALLCR